MIAITAAVARRRSTPCVLWAAVVLTTLSFVLFEVDLSDGGRSQATWRQEASRHVAQTLVEVGDDVARLEDASTAMSARVAAYVAALDTTLDADPPAAFALLDSLSAAASRDHSLASGAAIGFQLFDADGVRVAWSGWPQTR
jgi:hypothetical protein